MLHFFTVARSGGTSRRISGTLGREGRGECCDCSEDSMWQPSSVSVKEHTVLVPMVSLELCTDRMSDFLYGPISRIDFITTMSNHTSLLVVLLLFRGRIKPRVKTSFREQGPISI
jgi:hypothetical protein